MKNGILLLAIGNVLAWLQFNSQFVWDFWKDKPILSNVLFSIPMGLCFWYAIKSIVEDTGELWTSKLVGFGVSNVIFAIMTYALMKESMLTAKTLICLSLGMLIIAIQIFWK
tara:strand:+ start:22822 stop:23157 length:336 start_codon:yes stop_codon:yes gene_type:complete